ncbi:MAG: hypothetical protein KKE51_08655 [Gammaproteobacteria bacterium]|jgi:hypothetical protein|nr:hypothetical protein [Gammaproteobacteria bacterium]MBU1602463.1 hypothetical protein [Gammaproteobacteria bacterium]MBU2433268.1 hypothetical protein [Gammaproteobacteria bacterium]MBU2451184.1 hypothetical protein [Gammaproteobacteria bacterium]
MILYLDFDGVVHALGEPALNDNFKLLDNPNLFKWLPILEQILEPYPEVRIVISSDWRRLFDDDSLKRLLGPAISHRFAGIVEVAEKSRANEILMDAAQRGLTDWLALDDHPTVVEASRTDIRFIVCKPETGLSSRTVQATLKTRLNALLSPLLGQVRGR